jgi:hypothetical protein
MSVDLASRHPATQEKMRWLTPNPHLPDGAPSIVSAMCFDLGMGLLEKVGDGPQLTIGLQFLIAAKDAAVRQAIADAG